jgi:hypothetical protein
VRFPRDRVTVIRRFLKRRKPGRLTSVRLVGCFASRHLEISKVFLLKRPVSPLDG